MQGIGKTFEEALRILSHVEETRNEDDKQPVVRKRVYEETRDFKKARWRIKDVPLAFRPYFEYGWRYVTSRVV